MTDFIGFDPYKQALHAACDRNGELALIISGALLIALALSALVIGSAA